ncbi:hypothetical protein MTBUT4_700003 [Magnetospirillum sp. UT-4]|nr:hypothetical protein MTBUT4_700003 [Magnetospirillum sp. UT-4]
MDKIASIICISYRSSICHIHQPNSERNF